jgi:energy-coupling factor transporter transmembrane protein EcfT
MWIIIIFVVIIFLGALLGGNSLGESIRMGCGFILFIIIGLYFYNKCSSGSINNEPHPSICQRCGGDGELNYDEQKVFFQSNVLSEDIAITHFQDWMDEQGKPWVEKDGKYWFMRKASLSEPNRHLNGEGYGSFGPQTSKIYKIYKVRWWKSITSNKTNILCSKCCLKCENSQN